MSNSIQAVILGAGGYVGGELLRLIAAHPRLTLAAAVSDSRSGQRLSEVFPHLQSAYNDTRFQGLDDWHDALSDNANVALFSAAPHGAAARILSPVLAIAKARNMTLRIVDCSADFRFRSQSTWESVYATSHGAPDLIDEFSCAVPEHVATTPTDYVGHPGCFATAALLAVVPLLRSGVTGNDFFLSGVTGSTGSGRTPKDTTHHPERNSNFYAYQPLTHRHSAEITELAAAASGVTPGIHFVPHSAPFARGIHMTVQAPLTQSLEEAQLRDIYVNAYEKAPFVHVVEGTPRIKNVVASNYCHLGVAVQGNSVVVMSTIDNLVKGAAGGAMQWMNRLWSLPETSGLTATAAGWN